MRTRRIILTTVAALALAGLAAPATAVEDTQTVNASLSSTLAVTFNLIDPLSLGLLSSATNTTWHDAGSITVSADLLSPYTVTVAGAPMASASQAHSLAPLNISLDGGTTAAVVSSSGTLLVGDGGLTTAVLGGEATFALDLNQVVTLATDPPADDYTTTLTYTVAESL